MPVDTSMYANAVPPPPNPLATMGQVQGLIGSMNQNKLFQQEFAGRQAMGDVIKAATNPVTGETDWDKAMGLLSQDPRGARMLPEFAAQQMARQKTMLEMQQAAQNLAQQRFQAANAALGALLNKTDSKGAPAYTAGDAYAAIADLFRTGLMDGPNAMQWLEAVPRDQTKLTEFLQQAQVRALAPAERKPVTAMVDTGGQVNVVQTGPLPGQVASAGTIDKSMTPGEAAEPVEIFDAITQQMRKVPKSVFAQRAGAGGGRAPGAIVPPGGSPGLPSGPPLGTAPAAAKAGEGSATALNAMYENVGGSGARMFNLRKALEALEKTPTGPGTKTTNYAKSFLAAQTPFDLGRYLPGVNVDEIKNYDEANKYLQQYAQGQAAALGAGTDSKLAAALSANANTSISNLAAREVVKANLGLERYRQAQAQAWEASGSQPHEFNAWNAAWNRNVDVRAFVWDMLTDPERKATIKGMPLKEKSRLLETIQWAQTNGLY